MDRCSLKKGFTLAEMLVVLLIVSLVAIASVPLAHKRFKVHKPKTVHGKYECYYDGDTLKESQWENGVKVRDNVTVATCNFTPNPKATYFIVQAIGGGGGGAYSGGDTMVRSESTYSDTIDFPTDGNISVPATPDWLTTEFNNAGFQLAATTYGGGGGGGLGNARPVPQPDNTCPTGEWSNAIDNCHWYFDSQTTGGTGGRGGSCTTAAETLTSTTRVKLTHGAGGGSASGGGNGEVIIGTKNCTATGGGAGGNATPTVNGSTGSDGSPNPTVAGGLGGYSWTGSTAGMPLNNPASGSSGSSAPATTTVNGNSQSNIPYSYTLVTKQLSYGEGGAAGTYTNMFFSKLASNITVTVGKGGLGGTSAASDHAGQRGGDTKVGPLTAKGGDGGSAIPILSSPIDLYTVFSTGGFGSATASGSTLSYIASPTYMISATGRKGVFGSFYAVVSSAAAEGADVTADALLGNGGDGGGSSACVGLNAARWLNDVPLGTLGVGSTTCKTTANDLATNVTNNGSRGHSGAVVIIW